MAGTLKIVKQNQDAIAQELEKLGARFGRKTFRLAAQRYFKREMKGERLQLEITRKEQELARLKERGTKP